MSKNSDSLEGLRASCIDVAASCKSQKSAQEQERRQSGPIPLPTERSLYRDCATHKYKDSREQLKCVHNV